MLQALQQNPVVVKELRGRMRGKRAFILITFYLLVLSCLLSLVYLGFVASSSSSISGSANSRQVLGKTVFWSVAVMELFMVCFIAPALTAGAISSERERQTMDLLRTTLLSPRSLVLGKLFSSLSFLILLLLVGLPLQSLAYLLGGVTVEEVLIAFLILVVTAIFYSTMGLFVSSFLRRTLASTVLAYAVTLLIVFGIPALIFTSTGIASSIFNASNPFSSPLLESLIITAGWFLIVANPLGTGVLTEMILLEYQSLFYMSLPISNGKSFIIISPWIGYTILYLASSLVMIRLSITLVRRPES